LKIPHFLFSDLGLVSFANLFQTIFGAIFWIALASILILDNYGKIQFDLAIPSILGAVGLLGLSTTVIVYTAKGNQKIKYQANFLVLIASVGISIPLYFINWTLPAFLISHNFFAMAIAYLLGQKRYKEYSAVIIGSRVTQLILSFGLYFVIGNDGILLGYAIAFFIFSYRFFSNLKFSGIGISEIKPHWNFTLNNFGTHIIIMIYSWLDKVIIAIIYGFSTLGLYTLGYQFQSAIGFVPSTLSQYLLPQEASGKETKKIRIIGYVSSAILTVLAIFLIPIFLPLLFPSFEEATVPAMIMMLTLFPATVVSIAHSQLQGRGKSKPVLIGTIIFVSIMMSGIFVLGQLYGLEGIAASLVISYIAQSLYIWLYVKFKSKL